VVLTEGEVAPIANRVLENNDLNKSRKALRSDTKQDLVPFGSFSFLKLSSCGSAFFFVVSAPISRCAAESTKSI
jgi:hypothetical protein